MKLGVIARDFRVYNRLLTLLKGMNEPFVSLRPEDNYTGFDIVFTDMELRGSNIIRTDGLEEFRLRQLVRSKNSEKIVVGIDPGPAPGIATLANNVVIDRRSIYDFRDIRESVRSIHLHRDNSLLRNNNGSAVHRELLCEEEKAKMEEVVRGCRCLGLCLLQSPNPLPFLLSSSYPSHPLSAA